MVPKAYRLLPCIGLPVSCDRLAGCRRVDARFTLAIWTLAFGPSPLDIGPVGRLSLSTPVVIGTRHCWRGMVRETARSTSDDPMLDPVCSPDETSGSRMKFRARWLPNRTGPFWTILHREGQGNG